MGFGRPSEYDPKYCQDLIDHMAAGFSFESFGAHLARKYGEDSLVSKQTCYTWLKQHKDFLDAKQLGDAKALIWFEEQARNAISGKNPQTNSTMWIFTMKNRFGWRDRSETEVTHSGTVENTHRELSPVEHMNMIRRLQAEKRKLENTLDAEIVKEPTDDTSGTD